MRAATPFDAASAAPLLFATGPAYFTYVLGAGHGKDRAMQFTQKAFAADRGPLSHVYARVTERDGVLVGITLGYPIRDKAAIERAMLTVSLRGYSVVEWFRFVARGLKAQRLLGSVPPDGYYLGQLAVADSARGQGLGRMLLEDVLQRATEAGHRQCMLHVSIDNERAVELYKRSGFLITAEMRDFELERATGLCGQYAMIRKL